VLSASEGKPKYRLRGNPPSSRYPGTVEPAPFPFPNSRPGPFFPSSRDRSRRPISVSLHRLLHSSFLLISFVRIFSIPCTRCPRLERAISCRFFPFSAPVFSVIDNGVVTLFGQSSPLDFFPDDDFYANDPPQSIP